MNLKGTKKKNQVITANIFEQQEFLKKAEVIRENLKASTWHELETNGKFDKNAKLSFISDDMLILGCDVGSETHYVRAIDTRGREFSKSAFSFHNDSEGFQSAKEWAVKIAAEHNKNQIVPGLEPTGHYWFCLAAWMISNGISVVQVNPYAVKQTKEVEDNSQLKDDTKDPKLIANLVKDGNFGMPYLPEKLYGELRRLSMFRDQLNEDRIRSINRMHREMKIYFPEYKDALGKVDGAFSLELLKQAPFPDDLTALGEDGIRQICIAPTKTFNLAGLQTSAISIPDKELRHKVWRGINTDEVAEPNTFAVDAAIAAFTKGDKWLDELREYIYENKQYAMEYVKRDISELQITPSTATYLLWIDCSRISDDAIALAKSIRKNTGLYLSAGSRFSGNGESFLRMNIACPRTLLQDGMQRLKEGIRLII